MKASYFSLKYLRSIPVQILLLSSTWSAHTFAQPADSWKHGEFTAWPEDITENWRLAHSLGYNSVAHFRHEDLRSEWRRDLQFFLVDPHKAVQPFVKSELTHGKVEQLKGIYPYTFSEFPELPRALHERELAKMKEQHPEVFEYFKNAFERNKAWSHPDQEFPNNLAQLQTWGTDGVRWEPCPDFQQQRVIDETIANTIRYLKGQAEIVEDNFLFKGFITDVPEIWEEFNWNSNRGLPGKPSEMRRSFLHPGITHEYTTLREGYLQYLAQLKIAANKAFPGRDIKHILEPTPIYSSWVAKLKNVTEPSLTPEIIALARGDFLVQEKPGLGFLENKKLFADNWWDLRSVGSSTPDIFPDNPHYDTHLKYFGEIATRGSWLLTVFTLARGRGTVTQYDPQYVLMRALTGWENMQDTPVEKRIWDDEQKIYFSPTAWATEHAVAGVHNKNGMIYGVFLDEKGSLPLANGVTITELHSVNKLWEPTGSMPKDTLDSSTDKSYPFAFAAKFTGAETPFAQPEALKLNETLAPERLIVSKLYDPSFEEGGTGWHSYGATVLTPVDQPVAEGKKAMWVNGRKKPWHSPIQNVTGYLMAQMMGTYKVKALIRATEPGQRFDFRMNMMEHSKKFAYMSEPMEGKVGEWITMEAELNIDWEDALDSGSLNIRETSGGMADFYVDAVEFKKMN